MTELCEALLEPLVDVLDVARALCAAVDVSDVGAEIEPEVEAVADVGAAAAVVALAKRGWLPDVEPDWTAAPKADWLPATEVGAEVD